MLLLLAFGLAFAEDGVPGSASHAVVPRPIAGHPIVELRLGVDATALGAATNGGPLPTVCAEVTPIDRLSVEGCGNGAGVLHDEDVSDMAHFRLRYEAARVREGAGEAALVVSGGFAEVQRGRDAPGFRFGPAAEGQNEAAGAEAAAGVKARWWPYERAYLTMEVGGGVAWIPGAPEVIGAEGPAVGFAGVSVGAGF